MDKVYSATMVNTGGRAGEAHSPDNSFTLKIAQPGSGAEGTNPEQLFAAGYAACFNSALSLVMLQERLRTPSTVTAIVTLYKNEPTDFFIGVEIEGHIEGATPEQTQALLEKAHQVCPYSKATRGNIEVTLKAV